MKDQLDAISRGFHSLIPPAAAASLKPLELALLLNGRSDIDLEGLKANAQYTGGLTKSRCRMSLFWQVMDKMNVEQRRTVLKYITGTSQYPLDTYDPPFTLTHAEERDEYSFASCTHLFQPDCASALPITKITTREANLRNRKHRGILLDMISWG